MASSVHLPSDRKLPFEVRDEIPGCHNRKYVGCYIVGQMFLGDAPPVAVYFVPTRNVSSYGDGASCKSAYNNFVVCRNAGPSPPPLPPSPPSP